MSFTEDHNVNTKNPFQSPATNDLFVNKNPFFNGGWSAAATPVPVNPFMVSSTLQYLSQLSRRCIDNEK